MIKLVMSDIDGTLLDEKHQLSEATLSVAKALSKRQVLLVLASARSPKAMEALADALQLTTPLVCFNGALIRQGKGNDAITLHELPLASKQTYDVYQWVAAHFPGISFNLYAGDRWLVDNLGEWERQEEAITGIKAEVTDILSYLEQGGTVHKLLCMGPPEKMAQLQACLTALDLDGVDAYLSKPTYLEIMNSQASKLAALQFLCQSYQLDPSEVAAIGDNFNDLAMINYAGIGIAMGNAPQEVKDKANIIGRANTEEGFSTALASVFSIDLQRDL